MRSATRPPSRLARRSSRPHVLCRFQRRGIAEHGGLFSPSPRGARRAGSGRVQVRLLQGSGRHGASWPQPPCLCHTRGGSRVPGKVLAPAAENPQPSSEAAVSLRAPSPKPAGPPPVAHGGRSPSWQLRCPGARTRCGPSSPDAPSPHALLSLMRISVTGDGTVPLSPILNRHVFLRLEPPQLFLHPGREPSQLGGSQTPRICACLSLPCARLPRR